MSTVRQGLILAIALSTVAFTTAAMAGQGGNHGRDPHCPGSRWRWHQHQPGSGLPV